MAISWSTDSCGAWPHGAACSGCCASCGNAPAAAARPAAAPPKRPVRPPAAAASPACATSEACAAGPAAGGAAASGSAKPPAAGQMGGRPLRKVAHQSARSVLLLAVIGAASSRQTKGPAADLCAVHRPLPRWLLACRRAAAQTAEERRAPAPCVGAQEGRSSRLATNLSRRRQTLPENAWLAPHMRHCCRLVKHPGSATHLISSLPSLPRSTHSKLSSSWPALSVRRKG